MTSRRDDIFPADRRTHNGWADYSEFGGGRGENRRRPDGSYRQLSAAERARDMRREGLTGEAPPSILGSALNKNRGPVQRGEFLTR